MPTPPLSRRSFLALSAMLPWAFSAHASTSLPVGLELYSVRESLKKDPQGTVRAVAEMGYECMEFYAPYFDWSESDTKDMRKLLDDLHVHCYSTHNSAAYFTPESLPRLVERNQMLGAKYAVMASSAPIQDAAGWKDVADVLNRSA